MAVGRILTFGNEENFWMKPSTETLLEPLPKPAPSPAEAKFAEMERTAKAELAALDVTLQQLAALSPQVTTAAVAAGQAGKVERLIGTV